VREWRDGALALSDHHLLRNQPPRKLDGSYFLRHFFQSSRCMPVYRSPNSFMPRPRWPLQNWPGTNELSKLKLILIVRELQSPESTSLHVISWGSALLEGPDRPTAPRRSHQVNTLPTKFTFFLLDRSSGELCTPTIASTTAASRQLAANATPNSCSMILSFNSTSCHHAHPLDLLGAVLVHHQHQLC
jgi:hypothetical protein